ncbi:uncharacterized protein LOC141882364 [Acropora palmata]|uniref:uncharacterized protein LOC141882364 n=1 Tax=Acropora palmata TaxID=6131 RepID=UPI003DA13848
MASTLSFGTDQDIFGKRGLPSITDYAAYDDTVEPVPSEEEALQYPEQLPPLEEEEQQTLLPRFSGEDDTREWCKCSHCSLEQITKPDECWCCMEITRCCEKMEESKLEDKCIVDHPWFLQPVAYRQYIRPVYEYVGTSRRILLPKCVYSRIRKAFPNADGEYVGYEEEERQD